MNVLFLINHYRNTDEVRAFLKHLGDHASSEKPGSFYVALSDNSGDLDEDEKRDMYAVLSGEALSGSGNRSAVDRESASGMKLTAAEPVFKNPELASGKIDLTIMKPGRNPGYLGGCHLALEHFRKSRPEVRPDWLIICNTDLVFEPGFFSSLTKADPPPNTGMLAPDLRLPDGRAQNPFLLRRPSRTRLRFYAGLTRFPRLYALWSVAAKWRGGLKRSQESWTWSSSDPAGPKPVYAAHGALMLLHRTFFEKGGTLQSDAFLYHEELFLADQMSTLGLQVLFMPELRATHHQHAVTSGVDYRLTLKHKRESLHFILDHGRKPTGSGE